MIPKTRVARKRYPGSVAEVSLLCNVPYLTTFHGMYGLPGVFIRFSRLLGYGIYRKLHA